MTAPINADQPSDTVPGVSPAQQTRILGMSTVAFTVCFAVWTIFSIIGVQIKQDLGLSDTQFGLLVGTPILTGSLSRIFLGIWTDQYGGRIVNVITNWGFLIFYAICAAVTWFIYSRRSGLLYDVEHQVQPAQQTTAAS